MKNKDIFSKVSLVLFLGLALNSLACSRNMNHLVPVGGYCGVSTEAFKNPYSNEDIDPKVFTVIEPAYFNELKKVASEANPELATTTNRKYRAASIGLLLKGEDSPEPQAEGETYKADEQMMFAHNPVFNGDVLSTTTFTKTCARGVSQNTNLKFNTVLPTEIILNDDLTWQATQSFDYNVQFGAEFKDLGFIKNSVDYVSEPTAAEPSDFGFVDYVFMHQIGELTKAQKDRRAKQENAMNEVFMQVQVSDKIFARILFIKYDGKPLDPVAVNPKLLK